MLLAGLLINMLQVSRGGVKVNASMMRVWMYATVLGVIIEVGKSLVALIAGNLLSKSAAMVRSLDWLISKSIIAWLLDR